MFNTQQFTDVTTDKQRRSGTTCYRDNKNPGVFYTSHSSGYVRRVIKLKSEHINNLTNEKKTKEIHTKYHINPSISRNQESAINKKSISIMLPTENMRLNRIQTQADKFNKKRFVANESGVTIKDNEIIITTVNV